MWQPAQFKEVTARETKRMWNILSLSIFFVLLIYTMPWLLDTFAPTGDTLDVSWAWMLGYGMQHHLQWGKSILFTYGPLGFLANPYFYSDHFLWGMASVARLLSWILFGLGFALILSRHLTGKKWFPYFALPIIIAWLVGASLVDLATQSAFIGILLLTFALDDKNKKITIASLLFSGIILAFGSLIKSTSLIIALFIIVIYPILWWYSHPKNTKTIISLLPMVVFVMSFLSLWALAGQNISHLPAYIRGTWAFASGYTPAMSTHGEWLQTVVALIILLLFFSTTISLIIKKDRITISQTLLLGVMVFWAWKEGFTRHDPGFGSGHAMAFFGISLLVAAVGMILLSNKPQRISVISVAGAYLLALICALPGTSLFSVNEIINYKNFVSMISSKGRRVAQQQQQTNALMRQFHLDPALLDIVNGHSVNIIPWNLMIAQAYHMNLVASPVIQAYSVYTPYLDHLNAQQIWKGKGADKIIYTFESIDGRYPIFDEPATFRAILTCYKTEYVGNSYSVLTYNQCAKPKMNIVNKPLKSSFNNWIAVPKHASYVNLDVRTTIAGHLINILYKPNQVHILFKLSDGAIKGPYRFIYPLGVDGLFIRYYIGSQSDANRLLAGDASGLQRIVAFKLLVDSNSIDYAKNVVSSFLSVTPKHPFKTMWGEIHMPVQQHQNTPLPLGDGQKATVMFSIPKRQLDLPAQLSTVSLYQGNYGNTATGRLVIKICDKSKCVHGARALSESHDNSFFSIHLDHALSIHPEDNLTLSIRHLNGNKPDALWIGPEKARYPQELSGPQGPLPGKAIRIALKYKPQEHK